MAIPDYESCMLPLLNFYSDGQERTFREAIEVLAEQFGLTAQERTTTLDSGQQVFANRIGWARTFMKKAGLIEAPKRGANNITARGLEVLKRKPKKIDTEFLEQFQEFRAFRAIGREKVEENAQKPEINGRTPEESLENAYQQLRNALAADLLQRLKVCSPTFFERVVVEVIVKMGYGGTRKEAAKIIGKSGDEGIDGIIKEDKLGLDAIYIQAKRWEGTVGRPEIHRFVGALGGQGAKKGVFITTSSFTAEAQDYVAALKEPKVVLIDGPELAQYMIDYNVGATAVTSYELKKVDSDYFFEE